jgi:hypothetical protein
LAGAEALPLVFEEVVAGPLVLEVDELAVGVNDAGELAADAEGFGAFDDFFATLVIEIDRPVVYPIGPLFGEDILGDDAVFVFVDFNEFTGVADGFAFAFLELGSDGIDETLAVGRRRNRSALSLRSEPRATRRGGTREACVC